MLEPARIEEIADELLTADRDRSTVPLLTARHPEMEIEDSYAVQALWAARRAAAGHRIVGHKIGLTSRAMQAATGITEPDYGVIFDDMVFESGAVVPFENYSNVRIEVELAFVLAQPLSGPELHPGRGPGRDGVRRPGPGDPQLPHRARGPHDRRHDQRQRSDGRHGPGGRPCRGRRGRPALGQRAALPQPDDRGDRSRRRCPRPSRQRGRLARRKALPARHHAGSGRDHPEPARSPDPMWVERGDTIHADYGTLGAITCRFE